MLVVGAKGRKTDIPIMTQRGPKASFAFMNEANARVDFRNSQSESISFLWCLLWIRIYRFHFIQHLEPPQEYLSLSTHSVCVTSSNYGYVCPICVSFDWGWQFSFSWNCTKLYPAPSSAGYGVVCRAQKSTKFLLVALQLSTGFSHPQVCMDVLEKNETETLCRNLAQPAETWAALPDVQYRSWEKACWRFVCIVCSFI